MSTPEASLRSSTLFVPYPAHFLGDFVREAIRPIALVPIDAQEGVQLRALHFMVSEDIRPDPGNYWLLQNGKTVWGRYTGLGKEFSLSGGLTANIMYRLEYVDPVLLQRGDTLAVRLTPRGQPAPITGLSVAPEWGRLAARRV